jgi:hypothetical protein
MNANTWSPAFVIAGWITFGTKIPLLLYSIFLLNVFPRNTITEDLLRVDGAASMFGYAQLDQIIQSRQKRNEIVSVTDDILANRVVWIVEFKDGCKKLVFVPKNAPDIMDTFENTRVLLYSADANEPFRCSQEMVVARLLQSPWALLTPWWHGIQRRL